MRFYCCVALGLLALTANHFPAVVAEEQAAAAEEAVVPDPPVEEQAPPVEEQVPPVEEQAPPLEEQVPPQDVEEVEDAAYVPPANAEHYAFQAEVHRMLDIVVNSLYQNKDVFLRELISNASDALDKIRFLSLTQPELLQGKDELGIEIEYDEEGSSLTIRDSGIGMTHDDMVSNLGTVARSGTTRFLESLQDKDSDQVQQIGQFGVGFYSAFLVADRVTVASKHPTSDKQYVWESLNGASDFHVYEDPRGPSLGRGTEITLYLKEDCVEYADAMRLRGLTKHYSEFVIHPIKLRVTETMEVEIDDEEEDAPKDETKDEDELEVGEDEDVTDEEDDELEDKPKKTKEVTTFSWEEINNNPAIWTRDKDEITDEEYQHFWYLLSGQERDNATTWTHFNAEGNINFKSILYLPEEVPDAYRFGNYDGVPGGMKLYVRKVLISDEFDLMPRYLGFIRGVVDSDDLPLNVNRETLQESKIIQVIKKKLVRKALDLIRALSKKEGEQVEEELDDDGEVLVEAHVKDPPYIEWYQKFSPSIKMGIIDDESNRNKLNKLLRFQTTKSDGKWISLEDYVENMKEWQDEIYVLAGLSVEQLEKSHFLEPFKEKDVEVVYLTDAVDEYVIQHMRDFDGKKFVHISSENVKFKDEDEDLVKRRDKAYKQKFKPLTKWLKKLYGGSVMRVAISKRLGSAPAIVSSSEYGHSANMERIMRAQAYQTGQDEMNIRAMKVFEINPRHPLILKLLDAVPAEDDEEGETKKVPAEIVDAAWILHDMALMNGGFPVTDVLAHSKRMTKFLQSQLAVESLELEPEIDPPVEEEEAPEIDIDNLGGLNMEDFDLDGLDLDNVQMDPDIMGEEL